MEHFSFDAQARVLRSGKENGELRGLRLEAKLQRRCGMWDADFRSLSYGGASSFVSSAPHLPSGRPLVLQLCCARQPQGIAEDATCRYRLTNGLSLVTGHLYLPFIVTKAHYVTVPYKTYRDALVPLLRRVRTRTFHKERRTHTYTRNCHERAGSAISHRS